MASPVARFPPIYKVLLLGDSGAGKSNLMLRFTKNKFHNDHLTTIGIDFDARILPLDGKPVKVQIWDTAGQERFRTISYSYFRGTHGVLLVYDVTSMKSFENVEHWMTHLRRDTENVHVILIGNKMDLANCRVVTYEMGQAMALRMQIPFMETSAKLDLNVEEAFLRLTCDIRTAAAALELSPADNDVAHNRVQLPQPSKKSVRCCST